MMRDILIVVLMLWTAGTTAQNLPTPPRFTLEQEPEQVLRSYPLGVITELAAHAHHGHPDHKITLPNGLEGWVYEVRRAREVKIYVEPSGTERAIPETGEVSARWSYTLVFGSDGKVVDLLFDGKHLRLGLSALQVQRRADPARQKLPGVEHGPHFPPGGAQERY